MYKLMLISILVFQLLGMFLLCRNPFGDIWLYYEDVCKRNNHSLVADAKMWINVRMYIHIHLFVQSV